MIACLNLVVGSVSGAVTYYFEEEAFRARIQHCRPLNLVCGNTNTKEL